MGLLAVSITVILVGTAFYVFSRTYLERNISSAKKRYVVYNTAALVFGLIALATSWIWAYLFNLFIALPALIFALLFIQRAKKQNHPTKKFITLNHAVLSFAFVFAIVMLGAMQLR